MTRGGFFGYTLPAQIATSLVTPHVISYYDRYDTFIGNNTRTYGNSIGLIKKVSAIDGTLVNYSYLADGTKTYSFSSVTHHLYKNRIFSWIFYKNY